MAKRVQRRRGTTAEHATFTGYAGESTVDTTKDTVVVHDGVAAGGFPLAREDLSNVNLANLIGVTELKLTDGTPDQVLKLMVLVRLVLVRLIYQVLLLVVIFLVLLEMHR